MSVKYENFEMPDSLVLEEETATSTFGRFIAEPFARGLGHTVGNSMRRMMLSALESPAIISVRIEGVPHEYMSIEGIFEDMINIILNFKGALLRKLPLDDDQHSHEPFIITSVLEVTREDLDRNKGQYHVTLSDIINDGSIEVINPDLHLFTVSKPMKREIELRVAMGRGYVPSERHIIPDKSHNEILIDSSFSPVRLVNYYVENTRVGQDTDFDRLILEVTTDGRITPSEAIGFAAQICIKHFNVFNKIKVQDLSFDSYDVDIDADQDEMLDKLSLRVNEIELSVRSTNCLSGANIDTIAELVSIPEKRMLEFRNFGKKSLKEIKDKLEEMGLHLGMDLSRYGITPDNIKELIRQHNEEKKSRIKELTKVEE